MGGLLSAPRLGYDYCYSKERFLGRGGFGEVWLVKKFLTFYAMKKLDFPSSTKLIDLAKVAWNNKEIQILRDLNHPNVVKYVDSFYAIIAHLRGIYIIMEYCANGDLRDLMQSAGPSGRLSNPLYIINLMIQICMGLAYIHSIGLIHRDIKPENIFIDSNENVKIGDFGCCKVLDENQLAKTNLGTPRYKAPEVGNGQYSYKSDMYSTGVVFSDLWSFVPPVLQGRYPAMTSLIIKLQSQDTSDRPTAEDTLGELSAIQKMITNANQVVPPQIPALPLEILHLLRPESA